MGCCSSRAVARTSEEVPAVAGSGVDLQGDESVAVSEGGDEFQVVLVRQKGDRVGAGVGNLGARRTSGVFVKFVSEEGLVAQWNEANPDKEITVGMRVLRVNGAEDYWGILEELHRSAVLDMTIRGEPANVQRIKSLSPAGTTSQDSLTLRFGTPGVCGTKSETLLPHVRAGDCDVDECAICLGDVDPDAILVQLPCKHAFHAVCAGRWLTSNCHRQCPLCKGDVVSPTNSQPSGPVGRMLRRRR